MPVSVTKLNKSYVQCSFSKSTSEPKKEEKCYYKERLSSTEISLFSASTRTKLYSPHFMELRVAQISNGNDKIESTSYERAG